MDGALGMYGDFESIMQITYIQCARIKNLYLKEFSQKYNYNVDDGTNVNVTESTKPTTSSNLPTVVPNGENYNMVRIHIVSQLYSPITLSKR